MYCSNFEGNLYTFRFDIQECSRVSPIYTLKKGKDEKFNDFDILSYSDTVFAVTSQKPKHLWIYDSLLSSRGGLVLDTQVGGSILLPFKSKS